MKSFIVEHLRCSNENCHSQMELEPTRTSDNDCVEGFLHCNRCDAYYPIINGVAIIVNDFSNYISQRTRVFGKWLLECKTDSLKKFLKQKSKNVVKLAQNRYEDGGAWFEPYMYMRSSKGADRYFSKIVDENFDKFYTYMAKLVLNKFSGEMCLDIGCATGTVTHKIAKNFEFTFGLDQSFSFISEARKHSKRNTEFIVTDSTDLPFSSNDFDLAIMLNVLDLVNPEELLINTKALLKENGSMIIADPYDFRNERGDPVKSYDGASIRKFLGMNGFAIDKSTNKESFIPWILRVNKRAYIFYFADLIIARRTV